MLQVIVDLGEVNLFGHPVNVCVYGYGLMLVTGFLLGIFLARWRARRLGEDPDAIASLGLLALVGGVVGSRAAFVIEKWDSQFAWRPNPAAEILNVTSGGLIYYGGAALAVLLILAYLRLRRLPVRRYLDIIAPSLMVGLAFGRIGCTLNGCCFGGRCRADYVFAMRFPYASKPLLLLGDRPNRFGGAMPSPVFAYQVATLSEQGGLGENLVPKWLLRTWPDGRIMRDEQGRVILKAPSELTPQQARQAGELRSLPVQPAQIFGVVNAAVLAGILLAFSRLREREGQVFALMLMLYPITRFVLESIRDDNAHDLLHLEFTHNQYTSMGLFGAGLLAWFGLRLLPAAAGPWLAERRALATARRRSRAVQQKGRQR